MLFVLPWDNAGKRAPDRNGQAQLIHAVGLLLPILGRRPSPFPSRFCIPPIAAALAVLAPSPFPIPLAPCSLAQVFHCETPIHPTLTPSPPYRRRLVT